MEPIWSSGSGAQYFLVGFVCPMHLFVRALQKQSDILPDFRPLEVENEIEIEPTPNHCGSWNRVACRSLYSDDIGDMHTVTACL